MIRTNRGGSLTVVALAVAILACGTDAATKLEYSQLTAFARIAPLGKQPAGATGKIVQSFTDGQLGQVAAMLADDDPFVAAAAEWTLARCVARANNYVEARLPGPDGTDPAWFGKYMTVTAEQRVRFDWARQAIARQIDTDPAKLAADVDAMIGRAEALATALPEADRPAVASAITALRGVRAKIQPATSIAAARKLWMQARAIQRPLAFANTDLKTNSLICFTRFGFHYKPNVCGASHSWAYKPGGDVTIITGLDVLAGKQQLRPVLQSKLGPGHVHGMDLWFDADKVVVGWAGQANWPPKASTRWPRRGNSCYFHELRQQTEPTHLYEIPLGGGAVRQLTDHRYFTDCEPTYLPNGDIVFASDRPMHSPSCDSADNDLTDTNLYRYYRDGKFLRRLTNNKDLDLHPRLLDNGLIAYLRWEYYERDFWDIHSVWTIRPDGTFSDSLFGQHLGSPTSIRQARGVPGSSKLVAIAAGHHCLTRGPVILVDPGKGMNDQAAITNVTLGSRLQEPSKAWRVPNQWQNRAPAEGGVNVAGGYFIEPFALSERTFLAGYAYGSQQAMRYGLGTYVTRSDVDSNGIGLYLLDVWGNMELIHRDPILCVYNAVPLARRPRPVMPPDGTDYSLNHATCLVTNVYEGLADVKLGTVKYIRLVETLPWPVTEENGAFRLTVGPRARWCPVRIIGTVPVESDGSAHFKVPVADNASVTFQALDANKMEIQRMRTAVSFMPGESRSCNGCHETRPKPPSDKSTRSIAASKPAVTPKPSWWGHAPIDYPTMIEPIIQKHCGRCHAGAKPKGEVDLRPGQSYNTLVYRKRVVHISKGIRDNGAITKPYQFGSHKSKLVSMLQKRHGKAKLTANEKELLFAWIDANAPASGKVACKRPGGRYPNRGPVDYPWKYLWAPPKQWPAMDSRTEKTPRQKPLTAEKATIRQ